MTDQPPNRAARVALALPRQPGAATAGPAQRCAEVSAWWAGRLVTVAGLAATAVAGFIGGITIAAIQLPGAEPPARSILSEPVPYTLRATAGAGPGAASQHSSLPAAASAAGTAPGSHSSPAAETRTDVRAQQGSKVPQPREGGYPAPPTQPPPDPDRLDPVLSDIHTRAEQLQEEQLRELAEQMEAAMGLAIGLSAR
jgi:hypothetical protein